MNDHSSPADEGGANEAGAAIAAALARDIQNWRRQTAAARPAIDRYMTTEDFALTTGKECGTADPDIMSAAVENFVIIPAFGIIQNSDTSLLFRPALVTATFDPRVEAIIHAAALADYLGSLYGEEKPDDPEIKALWDIVHDDEYAPGKRTLIPEPSAGGFQIYAFAVLLVGHDRSTNEPGIISFLTSPPPGPGVLIHIPSSVIAGAPHMPMRIPGVSGPPGPRRPGPSGPARAARTVRASAPAGKAGGGLFRSLWFWVIAVLFLIGLAARIINGPTDRAKKDHGDKAKETSPGAKP